MRYNIGDVIKYRQKDGKLFVGKITFNNYGNDPDYVIEVKTHGAHFIINKYNVIQNITEEIEEENNKNDIQSKVNALRRFAFSINVGDYIVPYSESYEKLLKRHFKYKTLFKHDDIMAVYYADIIYKVIKSDINGFTFKVIKSKKSRAGYTFEISTKECEADGYFLITDSIPEEKKKEFSDDDLPDVPYNPTHNFTIVHPTYEERFKLQVEENEKLKKELKEKQEANEILYLEIKKLSAELELARKSEKHLEICEKVLLEI